MMRLFRSLLVFLALLTLSAGGSWNVANAHQMHMPQQATSHHHAVSAASDAQAGDQGAHHQHHAEATKPCLDASAPGGDMPDHMGSSCCAAMACHMAVLPQTELTVSAVAIRAANPLPLETTVEGTLGPRLERPPRSLAA